MVKIYIAITFLLIIGKAYTQACSYSKLLPFEAGVTRFKVMDFIKGNGYKIINENTSIYQPDYLRARNVSVNKVYLQVQVPDFPCTSGKNIQISFTFSDDKLYRIVISSEYSGINYNEMKEDYGNLISAVLSSGKWPFSRTSIIKGDDIQIGEGKNFYTKKDQSLQFENVDVRYLLNKRTGLGLKVEEYYTIEVEYVNLFVTKLDRRGF